MDDVDLGQVLACHDCFCCLVGKIRDGKGIRIKGNRIDFSIRSWCLRKKKVSKIERRCRGSTHLWTIMLYDSLVPALLASTCVRLETKKSNRLTKEATLGLF